MYLELLRTLLAVDDDAAAGSFWVDGFVELRSEKEIDA